MTAKKSKKKRQRSGIHRSKPEHSYDRACKEYNEDHPEVKITFNADSSGTLLTQIEEGYESVTCSSLQHRSRWISLKQTDW